MFNTIRKMLPSIAILLIYTQAVNAYYCYFDYQLDKRVCTGFSSAARIGTGVGITVGVVLLSIFIRVARNRFIHYLNQANINKSNPPSPRPNTQMQTYSAPPAPGGNNSVTGPTNAYLTSGGNNNYAYDPTNAAQTPQYPPATYNNTGVSTNTQHAPPPAAPSAEPYGQQLPPPGYEYEPHPRLPSPPQKAG